jgi:hypothetical protein
MEDLEQLERLAKGDDPHATTALGKLALVGKAGGRSPHDGAKLLAAAAEAGSGEADALISVLIGAEAKQASDWDLALDYLGRAAARGWQPARGQLAVLARDPQVAAQSQMDAPPSGIWRQLKDAVDVQGLLRPPRAEPKFENPDIKVIKQFATRNECQWLVHRARPNLSRAGVFGQRGKDYDATRTSSGAQFNILDADLVLIVLRARIAAATGVAVRALEDTSVLHYAAGQEFKNHCDYLDPRVPGLETEIARTGQRVFTFLVYLNDDFAGGETAFERLRWQFKGRTGDALLFRNVNANDVPDPRTLHAGLPPRAGEKWLLSQWIR